MPIGKMLGSVALGCMLAGTPTMAQAVNSPGSKPAPDVVNPALIYSALNADVVTLTFFNQETGEVVGMVYEKKVDGLFCREPTNSVPAQNAELACHIGMSISNRDAMVRYHRMRVDAVEFRYGVGATFLEKDQGPFICQRVVYSVLNPVPRYVCYQNIETVGTRAFLP